MRNRSDELAVANGCTFDLERAMHAVWWIERFCNLYEGATGPMRLATCHKCGYYEDAGLQTDWDDKETQKILRRRAAKFAKCVASGHRIDWQYDCVMRLFGWVKHSERLNRSVRRFREASIFISKKNGKSPQLGAIGLYLLIGDGEHGQKVYLAAKDGTQARDIAGGHVVKMVEKSPDLREACTINKNLMRVTHEVSDSWLQPLSSANETTQKSKEGLNGSVLVDEVHVVDRKFVNRISRAGISRDEPLFAGFSTAGDDPDSYGKESFDFALQVISGEVENQSLFAAIYAAPQNLSDADLDADPLKWGRMANPAMGRLVDEDEYMQDYIQSKANPSKLAVFKMYRLNIWQNASAPWLDMEKWRAGERKISCGESDERIMLPEDYAGRECWSALDLASVKDFCSLTLCFPESDGAFTFFWWFWLPEETRRAYRDLIPIDSWLADPRCNLMLTPTARTDYGYIRSKYRELADLFNIRQLLYDDWNAEQTTQEISEGVRDHRGVQVMPGTGVERVNFSQGIKTMNEPTKRFEGLVLDGKCWHNGDPIAAWMAANATIKPDINGNYKPMKPKDGIKKIDGIVTAVMAHAGAELAAGDGIFNAYDIYGSVSL